MGQVRWGRGLLGVAGGRNAVRLCRIWEGAGDGSAKGEKMDRG